jgi:hypothetical protein
MLHLLFHLAIITTGASISNLIGRVYPAKIKFDITKYPVPTGEEPLDAPLRIAFTSAVAVTLFCLSAFVILMGRIPVFRTYIPFAAVLGVRVLTALIILLVGLFATSLTAFHAISFVTGLLVFNMIFSVAGLQNRGDVTLRDTACHYRLGLR